MIRHCFFFLLCITALAACQNLPPTGSSGGGQSQAGPELPKPGTLIAADSMRIKEDNLNNSRYSIHITADSMVAHGVYDVHVAFGAEIADNSFTMPKGGEKFLPVLKRGTEPYSYIIGFHTDADTTFYEYYGITGSRGSIEMKYLKAYSFQQQ